MSVEHERLRAMIGKLSASAAMALAAGLLMAPAPSYADHADDDSEKVGVCHQTGSGRFVFIRVGAPATEDDHGHGQHEGDEIGADSAADCPDDRHDDADKDDKDKPNKDQEKDKKDKKDKDKSEEGEAERRGRGDGSPPGRGRGHGGPRR